LRAFNDKWYGNLVSRLDHPSVSFDAGGLDDNPTIIVRQSYITMFDHVWASAFIENPKTGVIITGQPGTGVWLLSLSHFQDS
jgi:hypothetical protein